MSDIELSDSETTVEPLEVFEKPILKVKVIDDDNDVIEPVKPKKKVRAPMSEERKQKLRINLQKARDAKTAKKKMSSEAAKIKKVKIPDEKPEILTATPEVEVVQKVVKEATLQQSIKKPPVKKMEVIEEEMPQVEVVQEVVKKHTDLTSKKKRY